MGNLRVYMGNIITNYDPASTGMEKFTRKNYEFLALPSLRGNGSNQ